VGEERLADGNQVRDRAESADVIGEFGHVSQRALTTTTGHGAWPTT
jgi:hypothetical protein